MGQGPDGSALATRGTVVARLMHSRGGCWARVR